MLGSDGSGYNSDVLAGIQWAVKDAQKRKRISMSLANLSVGTFLLASAYRGPFRIMSELLNPFQTSIFSGLNTLVNSVSIVWYRKIWNYAASSQGFAWSRDNSRSVSSSPAYIYFYSSKTETYYKY